jgi:hypothetical protein
MCKVFASTQSVRANINRVWCQLACHTDAVNVLGDNALPFDYFVELGSATVQDDGVETDAVQEADTEGQLIHLVEDGASNFDHGEFCGLRGIGGRGKDAQMAFDFTLSPNRVQESSDCLLRSSETEC